MSSVGKGAGGAVPASTVALPPKKRKRRTSLSSQGGSLATTSEDEVMPTATTSRARGAARTTRGVTLQDLLIDNQATDGAPIANTKPSHKANGASQGKGPGTHNSTSQYHSVYDTSEGKAIVSKEESEEQAVPNRPQGMYPPPWRTLALASLVHVCKRSAHERSSAGVQSSSPSMRRTASASSSATVPLDMGHALKFESANAGGTLQIRDSRQITPARQPKLKSESINGDFASETRSHSGFP